MEKVQKDQPEDPNNLDQLQKEDASILKDKETDIMKV